MVHITYNLNMYYACVDHEMHTHFCYTSVNSCDCSSVPRTHEKTHELYMHIYTLLHTHACHY